MKSAHPIELALVIGLAVLNAVRVLVAAAVALVIVPALGEHRLLPSRPVPRRWLPSLTSCASFRLTRLHELAVTRRRCSKDRLIEELLALQV